MVGYRHRAKTQSNMCKTHTWIAILRRQMKGGLYRKAGANGLGRGRIVRPMIKVQRCPSPHP